jgi:phosphoglycerate dehydrogenase-like enzyme
LSTIVLIASYLEPDLVDRIRRVDDRVEVLYRPDLLPPPRYPADHHGRPFERTAEQEAAWRALLARADVLFDFDYANGSDLARLAPRVRWIQATSSGIGQYVARMGYSTSMPGTVFTTARGVHAQPLAEFCVMAMLAFRKKLFPTLQAQQNRHWERFASTDLYGRTIVIVGMGRVGTEIARLARAFGMRVVGVKRSTAGVTPADLHLDELYSPTELHIALPKAEHLVLIAPHTMETGGMIGASEFALLPVGAVFINISRGALVDEAALIEALRSDRLAGAALDVFGREPLPPDSPLWDLQNVIVSPHSASTSDRENARLTDLFCANLRRFLDGIPLENRYDAKLGF